MKRKETLEGTVNFCVKAEIRSCAAVPKPPAGRQAGCGWSAVVRSLPLFSAGHGDGSVSFSPGGTRYVERLNIHHPSAAGLTAVTAEITGRISSERGTSASFQITSQKALKETARLGRVVSGRPRASPPGGGDMGTCVWMDCTPLLLVIAEIYCSSVTRLGGSVRECWVEASRVEKTD